VGDVSPWMSGAVAALRELCASFLGVLSATYHNYFFTQLGAHCVPTFSAALFKLRRIRCAHHEREISQSHRQSLQSSFVRASRFDNHADLFAALS
jgi:hypothetical protein